MVNLKNKLSIILIFFICFEIHSQVLKSNIILIIDNEIVTNNISMTFKAKDTILTYDYHLGNEFNLNTQDFDKDVDLKFNYLGKNGKMYNYTIKFSPGWLNNTNYLIIRIYNLDKKEFKKVFCEETKDYAIEIQNQVYSQVNVQCREFKNRL